MSKSNNTASSGKFHEFISDASVLCQINVTDSRTMIGNFVDFLVKNNPELNKDDVVRKVFGREAVFPKAITTGLAMPFRLVICS